MKAHIRVDDYPYGTPEDKLAYNKEIAAEKLHVLNSIGKCMIGCVMDYMTEYEWAVLEKNTNLVPCIHGFTHGLNKWRPISGKGGEFNGTTREDIWDSFGRHLYRINKHKMTTFIPPFNAITQNLIDECLNVGILFITGGPETLEFGMDKLDYKNIDLKIAEWYDTIPGLLTIASKIKEFDTLCFHLPWECTMLPLKYLQQTLNLEVVPYA